MATRVAARRPMGLGDLLDGTFGIYRQHFGTFVALGAIFLLPELLLNLVLRLAGPSNAFIAAQALVSWFLGLALYAAMIPPSAEAALGATPSVVGALRRVGPRLGPVLRLGLLYTLALGLMAVTVVGIPLAIYFVVAWAFPYHALLLEDLGIKAALARSRSLARGSWWRVFGLLLLLSVLTFGILLVLSLPAALAEGLDRLLDPAQAEQSGAGIVLGELTTFVAQILAYPIGVIGWTLLYYDLRLRKEGLDLELRAHELASTPPAG